VLARLEQSFNVSLPLREFFRLPTAAAIGAQVNGALERSGALLPAVAPRAQDFACAMSFAQQRMWLLERMLPAQSVHSTGRGVRPRGTLDVEALSRAFTALAARHESLRTRFTLVDGTPMQAIAAPMSVELTVEATEAGEARACAQREAQTPFDLARGPLWRVRL